MQKIINTPDAFALETVEGIIRAHASRYRLVAEGDGLVSTSSGEPRVAIATGGGSGHLPLFLGYVGDGLVDGAAIGGVFNSPSADTMLEVTKAIDRGRGVLYIYGNYGGDIMNFDLAAELAAFEGIEVSTVVGADDLASAPRAEADRRRGIAGVVFLYKIAGAAAARGDSLMKITTLLERVAQRLVTMGVALSPCILPAVGMPNFTIDDGDMEVGMGIHGEPGVRRGPLRSADEIADELFDAIAADLGTSGSDRYALLVNGLGATPREELYLLFRRIAERIDAEGGSIDHVLIGEYATSLEMAGASISLLIVDDELLELLEAPADSPMVHLGGVRR